MRPILLTQQNIDTILEQLRTRLASTHTNGKDITVTIPVGMACAAPADKPKICVTPKAHYKMRGLVQKATEEVAWHGLVSRADNVFTIRDILVFPQTVTASTATATDDYGLWVDQLTDIEFNMMRFHGHSHVNMGVSPSGVDMTYQTQLTDTVEDYYIFAIYNKRDDFEVWIYDKVNNVLYEKADIIYEDPRLAGEQWATRQITEQVAKRTYTAATTVVTTPVTTPHTVVTNTTTDSLESDDFVYDGYGKAIALRYQYNHTTKKMYTKKEIAAALRIENARIAKLRNTNTTQQVLNSMYDKEDTMTVEEYYSKYRNY